MILLFNDAFNSQDRDSGKEKQDLSHSVSENTTLRKLVLRGPSDYMTAVLHGVAASATIEDLEVQGQPTYPTGKLVERACLVTMATALLYCLP